MLEVENLRVDIPVAGGVLHAVRGVSFSLEKGETLCIVGESGCGKSLTSLALMGLLPRAARRTADKLIFDGIDLQSASRRQMQTIRGDRLSMIFQEPMTSLNPAYTIGDQLMEAMLWHKRVSRAEARERAIFLLEKVGITGAAKRLGQYPHQLSGGLRQRVMIAMSLMCGPAVIIADEPTTALDVTIQAQILLLLSELQAEFGMGLVLITHDLGVVARIADRVLVMYAGQVVENGSARQVFGAPLHPYTRGLLRCMPIPGRTRPGERLGSIPGIVPSLIGEIRGCAFRDRCGHARSACADFDRLRHNETGHEWRCIMDEAESLSRADELEDV
nr:ABC transporter ATP-binding protein [Roseitranquillus sediminis]